MKYVNLYLTNAKLYSMSLTNTPPISSNDINLTEITKTGEYYTLTATSNPQSFFIVPNAEINKIAPLNLDGPFEQLQMNTDKYYSDLNGFPLGLNPTTDTEGTEVDYITVNILEEDTDYLNKRGLKVFYDALQEKNLKLKFKNPDDFNIEKNSINLYDKYPIDERGKYILEHPDLMLESDFPISSSDPEDEFPSNWENYVIEQGEDAENFPYPAMDTNVLQTWFDQLSMEQWKNIRDMFLEQFPNGIETNSNINFSIDGTNYNFNYIWEADINPEDSNQFMIEIILPINSEQGWRSYVLESDDGKTWSSISSASHIENNATYSDRINYLISNTNVNTFSNGVTTWKENIKVFFLIQDWLSLAIGSTIDWEEVYDNGVPKNNPNIDCWWNGMNINWLYDLEYFSQFNAWMPYGLFIIDNELYYFDKMTIQNETTGIRHISKYPFNVPKNVIIFSDENNNIKMYSFNSDNENDSFVKKIGDTMTGSLNIISKSGLNIGSKSNQLSEEYPSATIGGIVWDNSGEYTGEEGPLSSLGPSSIATGFNSIALTNFSIANGVGAFSAGYAAHAEGGGTHWQSGCGVIQCKTKDYNTKQYYYGTTGAPSVGDVIIYDESAFRNFEWRIRYGIVTAVDTEQSFFTLDRNIEHSSTSTDFSNFKSVYVVSANSGSVLAFGSHSHAEGHGSQTFGEHSHAEGEDTKAWNYASHSEGYGSQAWGSYAHAEGETTQAIGYSSHAEGIGSADYKQGKITLKGNKSVTTYTYSFPYDAGISIDNIQVGDIIIGNSYYTSNDYAIITNIGTSTITVNKSLSSVRTMSSGADLVIMSKQGNAYGKHSHTEGNNTQAWSRSQHAAGEYNIMDMEGTQATRGTYAEIIGNGTADNARSNAATIAWNGEAWFSGDVYTGSTSGTNKDSGSKKLATEDYVTTSVSGKEDSSNKVTSLSSSSTNTQYPSAKLVYDQLALKQTKIYTDLTEDLYFVDGTAPTLPSGMYYCAGHNVYINGTKQNILSSNPFSFMVDELEVGEDQWETYYMINCVVGTSFYSAACSTDNNLTWVTKIDYLLRRTNIDTSIINPTRDTQVPSTKLFVTQLATKQNTLSQGTNITISGNTISATDTKNTAGSTDTSSKIYLVGATSQAANPQTYSDDEVYTTSGTLTAKEFSLGTNAKIVYNTSESCIEFNFS